MLSIDLAGDVATLDGTAPFVVGRDGDLAISDNPYLHRRFLEFHRHEGIWWVANVGSQTSATIEPGDGVHVVLSPGGRMPIVSGSTTIRFTAGPTSYELLLRLSDAPRHVDTPEPDDDGTATLGRIRLTVDQRSMLVVLAESALRRGPAHLSDIPSAAAGARRLGWTQKKFEKKIDNVCDRLAALGVRGLKGELGNQAVSRRARLVEYAVANRLVTPDDLALLDDGDRSDPARTAE